MIYIMLYHDALEEYSSLTDEQFGRLFRAALLFAKTGTETELSEPESILWPGLKMRILRDAEKYQKICDKRAEAAKKRWNQEHDTSAAMQMDTNASNRMQYKSESEGKCKSENNYKSNGKGQQRQTVPAQEYSQRDYSGETEAAMDRMMLDTWGQEDGQ